MSDDSYDREDTVEITYTPDYLRGLATLCVGQCCDLKVGTNTKRVWLCRVGGDVTIERISRGRWSTVSGSCTATSATDGAMSW